VRILLAGGAGFIGQHLTRRFLIGNYDVLVVDDFSSGTTENIESIRREFPGARYEVRWGDVRNLKLSGVPFDAVIHLASAASPVDYLHRPLETLEAGSVGTSNLLHIAQQVGARFLLASTSEVYGDPEIHPQPESYWGNVNPIGPRSVYDEAKRFAEAYTTAFARVRGVPVRIARIFNTYGPGMREDDGRVVSTFVARALRGDPLPVLGDGAQTRSYCFVTDLVEGLLRLLRSDVEGPVNLGNPEEYTVLETARLVIEVTGSASRIEHLPGMTDDPRRRKPDIARARRLLGWEPRVTFRQGIERTADAMANTPDPKTRTGSPAFRSDRGPSAEWSPRNGASAPGPDIRARQDRSA
jgi:dTDP-glucose 4,6-dehydratase